MREARLAAKRVNAKNDPALKAAARDLHDRWMDAVATDEAMLGMPAPETANTYDVSRQLEAPSPGPSQREESRKQVTNTKRLAA